MPCKIETGHDRDDSDFEISEISSTFNNVYSIKFVNSIKYISTIVHKVKKVGGK